MLIGQEMHHDAGPHGALEKIEQVIVQQSTEGNARQAEHITLGQLSDGMQERAFGLLLLLLALPCGLPFVYGLPQIVALPMLVLVFQMASGRRSPWLPEMLRNRKIPVQGFLNIIKKTRQYAGWLESLAHPRLTGFTGKRGTQIVGMLLLIPCASILVPLPLTNTVPGVAVAVASVGLIERDGLFVTLGIAMGLIWVCLLAIGGPTLIYVLFNWLSGT